MTTDDRFGYERALLRYMLDLRTPHGSPVIDAAGFFQDLADGQEGYTITYASAAELEAWALDLPGGTMGGACHHICFEIERTYRGLVGVFPFPARPDWLLVTPSPRWGDARFPAYNRSGRRVV